jgi:hypothetical protein
VSALDQERNPVPNRALQVDRLTFAQKRALDVGERVAVSASSLATNSCVICAAPEQAKHRHRFSYRL